MKKIIVVMFVAVFAMSMALFPIAAQAFTIDGGGTDVGEIDPIVGSISADDFQTLYGPGGGIEQELNWVNSLIDPDVFFSYKLEEGAGVGTGYFEVTNDPDVYAGSLASGEPDYYLLKFGGNDEDIIRILYENVDKLSWAVLSFEEAPEFQLADGSYLTLRMLNSVSHITAFVPEPTTMLLFGSSLVGLMLYGRRKSRKEADKTS